MKVDEAFFIHGISTIKHKHEEMVVQDERIAKPAAGQFGPSVCHPASSTTSPLFMRARSSQTKYFDLTGSDSRKLYSPRIWTMTLLLRGPSNSQKKIPCQVPRTKDLSLTKICSLQPTRELLQWASELPSECR